ncbi:MAG: nucleotide exchange factor GrpE [Bacteroidetes bacterium 4572_128]|nr:MAG: nucleotide exchange factor GrpE [Bacteroidetes bacterium 4572_128]
MSDKKENKKDILKDAPKEETSKVKSQKENEKTSDEKISDKKTIEKDVEEKSEEEILNEKLQKVSDKYLRLSAEFDNYRKRTLKEKIDLMKTASENVLTQLLKVVDDFERASKAMKESEDVKSIKKGMLLIQNKFSDFLKKNGIKEIDAMNKTFDTDLHEALTKIPVEDKKSKGKVVDMIEKGYFLNGKVIRFAKVVVGE